GVGVDLFQQAVAVGEGVDLSGLGYGQGVGGDDDIAPVVVGEGVGPVPVGGDVRLVHRGGCAVGLDQCDLAVPVVDQVDGALSACELVAGRLCLGCDQPSVPTRRSADLGVGVDLFQQAVAVGEGV